MLDFKFHERLSLAPLFADLLAQAIEVRWKRARFGVLDDDDPFAAPDLILPIPLSTQRLRERGYNQSWEIARRLRLRSIEQRQSRLCAHTLLRVRHTEAQSQLPLADRRQNLQAAFAVMRPVHGQRVALVDDVMTSGATLFEAAAALKRAGAAQVQAWVVARTP